MQSLLRRIAGVSFVLVAVTTVGAMPAFAQQAAPPPDACNQAMRDPIAQVPIDGIARSLVMTRDGCWLFVSVTRGDGDGIAVFQRSGGTITQVQFHRGREGAGAAGGSVLLTRDEKLLLVRDGRRLVFLDVGILTSGADHAVLGEISDQHFGREGGMMITADDRYLFTNQGGAAWLTVIDLAKARQSGFGPDAIVGGIPAVIAGPRAVFSKDERLLYVNGRSTGYPTERRPNWANQQQVMRTGGTPDDCDNLRGQAGFMVIDVQRATSMPDGSSVLADVDGGCGAPHLAISPDGRTLYVTSPQKDTLVVFDLASSRGESPTRSGMVPVGPAPRHLVTIDGGRKIVVSNSNDFSGRLAESMVASYLTVIDAARVPSGASAVLGTIPAGPAPSHLAVTADGRTLLVTDTKSPALYIIDLDRLALAPVRR